MGGRGTFAIGNNVAYTYKGVYIFNLNGCANLKKGCAKCIRGCANFWKPCQGYSRFSDFCQNSADRLLKIPRLQNKNRTVQTRKTAPLSHFRAKKEEPDYCINPILLFWQRRIRLIQSPCLCSIFSCWRVTNIKSVSRGVHCIIYTKNYQSHILKLSIEKSSCLKNECSSKRITLTIIYYLG